VRTQVQRVHPDGFDALAALGGGEVHTAAVARHGQVLGGEDFVAGRTVFLQADSGGQDLRGAGDVGALGPSPETTSTA
jgi:hypothetical protein